MLPLSNRIAPQSRTLWTSQAESLSAFRSPLYNLGIWTRTLSPALRMRLVARAAAPLQFDTTLGLGELEGLPAKLSVLEDAELEAFMMNELRTLLPVFAEIAFGTTERATSEETPRIRVRLDRITDKMCEKLHTDYVRLRLLCTYVGPGTEWVDDADADRSMLGSTHFSAAEVNESVPRHEDALRRCSVGDVIMLKGSEWSASEPGAIHRSPDAMGQTRILLRIDVPDEDA